MAQAVVSFLIGFLQGVPAWLQVAILSMIPIVEFRVSVPVALEYFHLPILSANLATFLGGSVVFVILYFGLERIREVLQRTFPSLLHPIDAFVLRSEKKLHEKYFQYGTLALLLFVAIPLPLTGVWTATVGAVALKIPMREAALGILSGLLLGQIVVTLLTLGASSLL